MANSLPGRLQCLDQRPSAVQDQPTPPHPGTPHLGGNREGTSPRLRAGGRILLMLGRRWAAAAPPDRGDLQDRARPRMKQSECVAVAAARACLGDELHAPGAVKVCSLGQSGYASREREAGSKGEGGKRLLQPSECEGRIEHGGLPMWEGSMTTRRYDVGD